MRGKACLFALLAMGSVAASADVVAWYRFDELDPGVAASTENRTLVNYANPGKLDMKLGSYSGTTEGFDTSLVPLGTNSFGARTFVYDPLTGNYHTNNRAMHFGARGAMTASAMPGSIAKWSPDGDGTLWSNLTNLTVEAIFRLKEDMPSDTTACIIQKSSNDGTYKPNWGLTINQNGVWQRYTHVKADGTKATEEGFQSGSPVSRGVWHHAAFTYDATGKARLFLDYAEVASRSVSGYVKLLTTPNNSLVIGVRLGVSGAFPGEIDEIRISDRALGAGEFLRIKPQVEGMDPDTLFYHPLDFDEGPMPRIAFDINAVTNARALAAKFDYESTSPLPQQTTVTPDGSNVLRQHALAPDETNAGSIYNVTNGAGKGLTIKISTPDRSLYTHSFTSEMFFRIDTNRFSAAWPTTTLMWGQLKVLIGNQGGTRARAYNNQYGYNSSIAEISADHYRLYDDQWHHAAFVYDYEGSNVTYYIDYAKVGQVKNVRLYEKSDGYNVFWFAAQNDNSRQSLLGWWDSPRIVARALKPHEFLTTHPIANRERTLAHYSWDADYSVEPYPYLGKPGTANVIDKDHTGVPSLDPARKLTEVMLDGEAGVDVKTDGGSVKMNGGQVRYPTNVLLERPSFTMEFFAKLNDSGKGTDTQFLRLNRSPSNWSSPSTWAPQFHPVSRNLSIHVYMKRADGTFNDQSPDLSGATGLKVPTDCRWHHYAFTSEVIEGTNTRITAYIDYQRVNTPLDLEGVFYYPPDGTCLSVGAGQPLEGWLNELRFSDGVLPVSAFMRKADVGAVILVR